MCGAIFHLLKNMFLFSPCSCSRESITSGSIAMFSRGLKQMEVIADRWTSSGLLHQPPLGRRLWRVRAKCFAAWSKAPRQNCGPLLDFLKSNLRSRKQFGRIRGVFYNPTSRRAEILELQKGWVRLPIVCVSSFR